MTASIENWIALAEKLDITLPKTFLDLQTEKQGRGLAWKFLTAAEALTLKADLDLRFDYPGREWRGVPFARSTVSEDVACFDLTTPMDGLEARVVTIHDWHGPRWEFSGYSHTFEEWLREN